MEGDAYGTEWQPYHFPTHDEPHPERPNWYSLLVYIDNIIIFGKDEADHDENLQRLRTHGIRIKPKKCKIAFTKLQFMGYVISGEGVEVDARKVEAIKSIPVPKTVKEVRRFLGMVNYYRRFIRNYASKTALLRALTMLKRMSKQDWTTKHQVEFDFLKEELMSTQIIAYPNMSKTFIIESDASSEGFGAVLM